MKIIDFSVSWIYFFFYPQHNLIIDRYIQWVKNSESWIFRVVFRRINWIFKQIKRRHWKLKERLFVNFFLFGLVFVLYLNVVSAIANILNVFLVVELVCFVWASKWFFLYFFINSKVVTHIWLSIQFQFSSNFFLSEIVSNLYMLYLNMKIILYICSNFFKARKRNAYLFICVVFFLLVLYNETVTIVYSFFFFWKCFVWMNCYNFYIFYLYYFFHCSIFGNIRMIENNNGSIH